MRKPLWNAVAVFHSTNQTTVSVHGMQQAASIH